jgi:hypothetical protein
VPNLIQIKRSLTSATPGALANGEFAYTANGDVLYLGSNGAVVPIGGKRNPGVLTANQALVANATSGIDKVIVANLVPTAIYANGSFGTAGQLLTSNGTAVHWNTPAPSVTGSNTQIQFNDEGNLGADADFTFNKVTNTLTSPNVVITSTTSSTNTTTGALRVGGGVGVVGRINTTDLAAGNDSVFSTLTGTTLNTANVFATSTVNGAVLSVGTAVIANTVGVFTTGAVNGASLSVGTAVVSNSTGVYTTGLVNALTVNAAVHSVGTAVTANSTGVFTTGTVNGSVVSVGTNVIGNSLGVFTTGTVNGTSLSVGSSVIGNSTGVFTTGTVNGTVVSVGSAVISNSSGVFTAGAVNGAIVRVGSSFAANTTSVVIGSGVSLQANGTVGTAGQVLHSNGSSVYWDVDNDGVTSVATGAGLTGGTITTTGTVSVLANNGIVANTSGLFVAPGTGVTVNATGVHIGQPVATTSSVTFASINVTGNSALGDVYADIVSINGGVNTNIMPAANTTYNLGNTAVRWNQIYSQNVHSVSGYFDGDVQISGNLSVLGTTITISANSLIVNDPLLQLAANNTSGDLLDIGFFGSYNPDGGPHEHTGLFRDATDDVFKLFEGLQESPTNVVNTAGVGYKTATLQSYLFSSGLTTNATHVAIVANSTVNVAITANTLTLATALAGTSGGTGRATTTNNAILVGNTTNGYNQLTLGADGYVLQSNGTALIYDVLDGGTF